MSPYAKPGPYLTQLPRYDEMRFQNWVHQNNVPFDPGPQADYDMRGFWLGLQNHNPMARNAIDPYDHQMHFPDYWKTPYHETFSNESQWAAPGAPGWQGNRFLVQPNGRVQFDAYQSPYVQQLYMPR